jgi:CheY-like chemotaxis protein
VHERERDDAMTASILVVDDESTTQDTLGFFLEAEGYRVATAGSGAEALSRIEEQEFDVIVADVLMPGVSHRDRAAIAGSSADWARSWGAGSRR